MHLSWFDYFLWIGSWVGEVILLLVLILRRRWKAFPVFTSLTAFLSLRSVSLFCIYQFASMRIYAIVYWIGAGIDFLFQLALLHEIAKNVLSPVGKWGRENKPMLLRLSISGVLLAAISSAVTHPSAKTVFQAWTMRGSLFTSLLVLELFLVIMFMSSRLALCWRNHVMSLGQGLSAWALVGVAVDIGHNLAPFRHFVILDQIRISSYFVTLLYWIFAFWRDEPLTGQEEPRNLAVLVGIESRSGDRNSQ